LESAPLVVELT